MWCRECLEESVDERVVWSREVLSVEPQKFR